MCLKAVDVRKIDKANGIVTVLQLTPKVNKDTYLFVSYLRVIYFDIFILMEEEFLTELTDN